MEKEQTINHILESITDPQERKEKEALLGVFFMLAEGLNETLRIEQILQEKRLDEN